MELAAPKALAFPGGIKLSQCRFAWRLFLLLIMFQESRVCVWSQLNCYY